MGRLSITAAGFQLLRNALHRGHPFLMASNVDPDFERFGLPVSCSGNATESSFWRAKLAI